MSSASAAICPRSNGALARRSARSCSAARRSFSGAAAPAKITLPVWGAECSPWCANAAAARRHSSAPRGLSAGWTATLRASAPNMPARSARASARWRKTRTTAARPRSIARGRAAPMRSVTVCSARSAISVWSVKASSSTGCAAARRRLSPRASLSRTSNLWWIAAARSSVRRPYPAGKAPRMDCCRRPSTST